MLRDCARLWNGAAIVEHCLKPKLYGFFGVVDGLIESVTGGEAAGKIGNRDPLCVVRVAGFYCDGVLLVVFQPASRAYARDLFPSLF
jgi:hypothetical protein